MAKITRHFAGYPSAYVYDKPKGTVDKPEGKVIEHLLWGQYVGVLSGGGTRTNGFQKVRIRKSQEGWMTPGSFQKERILEIVFVDIGQGDGCLLVTPDDEHFVIDAGMRDNMYRFLRWRYKFDRQDKPVRFKGVITHPDSDHYAGFEHFFGDPKVFFETFYQNGIMERQASSSSNELGPKVRKGRRSFVSELIRSRQDLDEFLDSDLWRAPTPRKRAKMYPAMLQKGRQNGSFGEFEMLDVTTNGGWLPGYEEGADFFRPYLAATNPLVTVMSSGDEESHSHPRADTLGTVGKYCRGVRSLLFNTELARSSGERVEIPLQIRRELDGLAIRIAALRERLDKEKDEPTANEKEDLKDELESLVNRQTRKWDQLARSVDVYGAINLRTDGRRIVMSQELEKKRGSDEWDIYRLEQGADGEFRYLSKYKEE